MLDNETNRQFRELADGLFPIAVVTSELQYSFAALDGLAHQKNAAQHDGSETIVIDHLGIDNMPISTFLFFQEPGVLTMSKVGGAGKHRGSEITVGYIDDRVLTRDQAYEDLYMAKSIKNLLSMVLEGVALVSVDNPK